VSTDDTTPKPRRKGVQTTGDAGPYRPPAPGEAESPTKYCPDCAADPEHPGEGGFQPVSEFRPIRGKGAERYANGVRLAAYCRYHEAKRARERKRAKVAQASPEEREAMRARERANDRRRDRKRRVKRSMSYRKWWAQLLEENPARAEEITRQTRERADAWAAAHPEERRVYRANWFRERMDREIAAGLRPPRGEQRGVGRPRGGGFYPASRRRR
jgi:hypothetical protein